MRFTSKHCELIFVAPSNFEHKLFSFGERIPSTVGILFIAAVCHAYPPVITADQNLSDEKRGLEIT